jgi:hypothetical protein
MVAKRIPIVGLVTAASLAIAPFTGFLYRNREEIQIVDLVPSLALAGCLVILLVLISVIAGRTLGLRWSIALGWCIFSIFWYRDVKIFVDDTLPESVRVFDGSVVWLVVLLTVFGACWHLAHRPFFHGAIAWFAVTIAIVPLGQYAFFLVSQSTQTPDSSWSSPEGTQALIERPDIYFLLLDGFGRQDVLEEAYGINIDPFVIELRNHGFVIADRALSAHPMTWLSIPAILDHSYQALPGDRGRPPTIDRQLAILAGASLTHRILMNNGYEFVTAATSYGTLCRPSPISEFEQCVVNRPDLDEAMLRASIRYKLAFMTPIIGLNSMGVIPRWVSRYWRAPDLLEDKSTHGGKAFLTSDILNVVSPSTIDGEPTPRFIFAHMMYSHPPFTLDSDCSFRTRGVPDQTIGWSDANAYRQGLECAISQVLELLDSIDPSAIVIIQSDHGPILGMPDSLDGVMGSLQSQDPPLREVWARASVFSAVRLPEVCRPTVSDYYAGVNTFPVIFACLSRLPSLVQPERSLWAWHDSRSVVDLTKLLRSYENGPK